MAVIALRGVTYRYAGGTRNAVSDLSLELRPGEVTLVSGPLGSGCSTLLLLAAGLAPRVLGGSLQGEVNVLGVDPRDSTAGRQLAGRVGILLPTPWTQVSGMAFTVRDEVAFGPANLGWNKARIEERVATALSTIGVEHLADRDPKTLSGGELQKVMFASVIAMDPEVLLLDEPAVELDPGSAEHLYGLLPALAAERAVVIATTDVDRTWEIAHRLVAIRDGRVVADGEPQEVMSGRGPAPVTTTVGRVFKGAAVGESVISVDDAVSWVGA